MENKGKLTLEILMVGLVWGTSFVATTAILEQMDILQFLAMRWGIAALVAIAFVVFKIYPVNYKGKSKKPLIIITLLQPCIYATLETIGLDLTTASEASIILALMPMTVALISGFLLKQKTNVNIYIAAAICITGVLFTVLFEDDFQVGGKLLGYIILYLCVLCGSAYTIIGNKIGGEYTPVEITIAMTIGGGLFFILYSMGKGEFIEAVLITAGNWKILTLLIYLGLFCSVLCFFLYNDINNKLTPAKTSLFIENTVTLVGVISAVIINGDSMSIYKVIGVAMLIGGIIYLSQSEEKLRREELIEDKKINNIGY